MLTHGPGTDESSKTGHHSEICTQCRTRYDAPDASSVVLAATVVGACGGDDPVAPEDILVTGVWSGTTATGIELTLTLSEASNGVVTGGGTFGSSAAALEVTVQEGTHVSTNLSLTMEAGGDLLLFDGTVESVTRIEGRLTGQGLFNAPLTINKS